eukprot:m.180699 g.180699  ORF g.180699 m.180699 type:complete len:1918 (+) comp13578_c0_seq1:442-6195(+)
MMNTYYQSHTPTAPVNLTIDLLFDYEIVSVDVTFANVVARSLAILRSQENTEMGFEVYEFYSADCEGVFNETGDGALSSVEDAKCDTTRSFASETTVGFRTLTTPRVTLGGSDFTMSPELQKYVCAHYIRLHLREYFSPTNSFDRFGALLDNVEPAFLVKDIDVQGRCKCNGHARECVVNPDTGNAKCVCRHNTMGDNCEMCLPMFNAKPWAKATITDEPNICHPCNCNNHAAFCIYNRDQDRFPNERDIGDGSVCMDCLHGTTGTRCELCLEEFYYNSTVERDDINACIPCACDEDGAVDNMCEQTSGQCVCKSKTEGRACDTCVDETYDVGSDVTNGCTDCECAVAGTVNASNVCNKDGGQCDCLSSNVGRDCSECIVGYFHPLSSPEGECVECDPLCSSDLGCNAAGNVLDVCNGKCENVLLANRCISKCPITHYVSHARDGRVNDECLPCHRECANGCSSAGALATACVECANFEYEGLCVPECPSQTYADENNVCQPCDTRCDECTGPSNTQCKTCVDVRYKTACLDECPSTSYLTNIDSEDVCLDCSDLCSDDSRCNGPGAGQCEKCGDLYLPTFDVTEPYPPTFLPYSFVCRTICPPHFFVSEELYTNRLTKEQALLPICRPCDEQCKNACDGPDPHECVGGCINAQYLDTCVAGCPIHTFPNPVNGTNICTPCHEACVASDGCVGPGNDDCVTCSMNTVDYQGICMDSCPPRTFEDNLRGENERVCTDCHPTCNVCNGTSAATCSECKELVHNDMCVSTCPGGTYARRRTAQQNNEGSISSPMECVPCNSECDQTQSCSGPSATECDGCGNVLYDGECVGVCPFNFTFENSNRTCVDCDVECVGGCFADGADECVRCRNFIFEGTCVNDCPLHTIAKGDICMPCHKLCEVDGVIGQRACSGLTASDCVECNVLTSFLYLPTGTCVSQCPQLETFVNSDRECVSCHEECSGGCDESSARDCVQCKNVKLVDTCVASCPPLFYTDGATKECQRCHSQCKYGCFGPEATQCSKPVGAASACLNAENDDGTCVAVCDLSQTYVDGMFCRTCNSECDVQGCTGPDAFECFGCKNVLFEETCTAQCPRTHFSDLSSTCVACDAECASRSSSSALCTGAGPNMCAECKNFKRGFTCVSQCNSDEIVVGNECITCHDECAIDGCYGALASECVACKNSNNLNTCVPQCDVDTAYGSLTPISSGTFIPAQTYCTPCHSECDVSLGSGGCPSGATDTDCVVCEHVRNNNRCVSVCPVGTFANTSATTTAKAGVCEMCSDACHVDFGCVGPSPGECIRCASGLEFSGVCVDECPPFTYSDAGDCLACDFNCFDGCFGPAANQCSREPFPMDTTAETLGCKYTALRVDLNTIMCQEVCPLGTYEDERGICRECSTLCAADLGCDGPGQKFCVPCDDGFFVNDLQECERCHSACNTTAIFEDGYSCSGNTASDCAACDVATFEGVCVIGSCSSLDNPSSGTYFYRETESVVVPTCRECNAECSPGGCTGPSNTQCVEGCAHMSRVVDEDILPPRGSNDPVDFTNLQCVATCDPLTTFVDDFPVVNACHACHEECIGGCTDATALTCSNCKRFHNADGTCVAECSNGYEPDANGLCVCPLERNFVSSTGRCVSCHPLCGDGCDGTSAGDCLGDAFGCTIAQHNGVCVASCPSNMQINEDTNTCECQAGFYPQFKNSDPTDNLLSCEPCHSTCAEGDACTGPNPSDCAVCATFILGDECVSACPVDYVGVEQGVCAPCHPQCVGGCSASLDSRSCEACLVHSEVGACVDSCSQDRPYLFANQCISGCPTFSPFYNDTREVDLMTLEFVSGEPSMPQLCVDACSDLSNNHTVDATVEGEEYRCSTPQQIEAQSTSSERQTAAGLGELDDLYLTLLIAGIAFIIVCVIVAVFLARRNGGYQISPAS